MYEGWDSYAIPDFATDDHDDMRQQGCRNNETTGESGLGVCEPDVDVPGVGPSPMERSEGARTPEVSSSSESRWKALIASLPSVVASRPTRSASC